MSKSNLRLTFYLGYIVRYLRSIEIRFIDLPLQNKTRSELQQYPGDPGAGELDEVRGFVAV